MCFSQPTISGAKGWRSVTTTRRWWVKTRDAFLPAGRMNSLEAGDDGRTNQDDWTRNVAAVSPRTGGEMGTKVRNSPIESRRRHDTWLREATGCHETLPRIRFGGRTGEVLEPTAAASALRSGRARGLAERCAECRRNKSSGEGRMSSLEHDVR